MFVSFSQETKTEIGSTKDLDSLYREDQFYISVSYNLLINRPKTIDQTNFSWGLHMGFIRDMPINTRRNVSVGLGVGYSFNIYNHNLFIGEKEGTEESVFISLDGEDFNFNQIRTHLVEAPLEFRFRTSVPNTHRFYRFYTGLRIGYLYHFKSRFGNNAIKVNQTNVNELDRWRVGATFTFGWNTFNFQLYYGLNSLFNNTAKVEGDTIGFNPIKAGLIFYLL